MAQFAWACVRVIALSAVISCKICDYEKDKRLVDERFRNQGFAKILYKKLISELKKDGYKKLVGKLKLKL